MADKSTPWIVLRDERFICDRCGTTESLGLPLDIVEVAAAGRRFVDRHRGCRRRSSGRPRSQLILARALAWRGANSTPASVLREMTEFPRSKVQRLLSEMEKAGRVQGVQIDAVELTSAGRAWLAEAEGRADA